MNDPSRMQRLIYFVNFSETDPLSEHEKELITQIGFFGYKVVTCADAEHMEQKIAAEIPDGIIVCWDFSQEDEETNRKKESLERGLDKIRREGAGPPAVIFLARQEEISHRLQSVRMGGEAFFLMPVDSSTLIDALDRLMQKERIMPYRVLIVDDSVIAGRFAQATLQKAGMTVEIISHPLNVMLAVQEFNPDIILLDMYMPDCTGMELAKVIRQMEKYVSIPIVYVSSEDDKDMQLEAMSIGADDFINKMDLKRHHLIGAVQSRVERYRKLRSMMTRDGLTGLLNHTTVIERIAQEMARAKRGRAAGNQTFLSLAMLDLDHFKTVNDTYGHATGDRVLRSLARFLQQRLRQSDTLGRYGGEEFVVVLPETDGANAVRVMDGILAQFSQIRHQAEGGEFSVTFSCGVASFPAYDDPVHITEAADQALYSAKRAGRNRVVLANPD